MYYFLFCFSKIWNSAQFFFVFHNLLKRTDLWKKLVEYCLIWNCLMIRFKLWIFGRNIAKLILSSSQQYFKFINSFIYSVWTSVDPIQWIFNSNTYICFFFDFIFLSWTTSSSYPFYQSFLAKHLICLIWLKLFSINSHDLDMSEFVSVALCVLLTTNYIFHLFST